MPRITLHLNELSSITINPCDMQALYEILPHLSKPGWFLVRDVIHLVTIEFQVGRHLETSKIVDAGLLTKDVQRNKIIIRQMLEWVEQNYPELL